MSLSTAKQRWVVLDLDHTLIYARKADMKKYPNDDTRNFWIKPVTLEFMRVTVRMYLKEFLDQLYERGYKVIVWSAGGDAYVKDVVSVIFKGRRLEYVLTHNHLKDVPNEQKVLSLITQYVPDFDPSQARLVDDSPDHFKGQEKLGIQIRQFYFNGPSPKLSEDDSLLLTMADKIDKSFQSQ